MFSAASAGVNSGFVGGGAGNDSVVVIAASGQNAVNGGKGNDSVILISPLLHQRVGAAQTMETTPSVWRFSSSTSVYGGSGDSIVIRFNR